MRYLSPSCEASVVNGQFIHIHFKKDITMDFDELSILYHMLMDQDPPLPILFDMSHIAGMDFDAMDFSLKEWYGIAHVPMAVVFNRGTISEKYAMMILNTQTSRPSLCFFDNQSSAIDWLIP